MAIQQSEFIDLLADTLPALRWKKTETLLKYQNWIVCDVLFGPDMLEDMKGGTDAIKWEIEYRATDSGGYIDPGEVRTPAMQNNKVWATLPIAYDYFDWSMTEHEFLVNSDDEYQITDHIKGKRRQSFLGWCERSEYQFFQLPDTSNNKKPYGLPYYLVPITSAQAATATAAGAHQGVHAAGFSTCANVSATTYARWRSYNACWPSSGAEITQTAKLRLARMFRHLNYRAPRQVTDVEVQNANPWVHCADETVIEELGKAAQQQNDNLGADVMKHLGTTYLNGTPVRWAIELDTADTTNRGAHPLYTWNRRVFRTRRDPRMWLKERKPMNTRDQPDVATTYVDCRFNWIMLNRQTGGGLMSYVA